MKMRAQNCLIHGLEECCAAKNQLMINLIARQIFSFVIKEYMSKIIKPKLKYLGIKTHKNLSLI